MKHRILGGGVALVLLAAPALAQRMPLFQDGTAIPHDLGKFAHPGLSTSVGDINGDSNGRGVNPLAITDETARALCAYKTTDDHTHPACLGHDMDGNPILSTDEAGDWRIEGHSFTLPGITASGAAVTITAPLFTAPGLSSTVAGTALSGAPTAVAAGPGDASSRIATTAWTQAALGAAGVVPIPVVATTAALQARSTAVTARVLRTGVNAEGDAAPMLFVAANGACADGGDTGMCVPSSDSNKWLARPSTADGIDARQFGIIAGSNDTATLQRFEAAACSADWPGSVPKVALLPAGNIALANLSLTCGSLKGAGLDKSAIVPGPGLSPGAGWLVRITTGGLSVNALSFVCATYADVAGAFVAPPTCPHWQLIVQALDTTQRVQGFTGDIKFVGGDIQFSASSTENIDLETENMWPYDFGVIVSDFLDGPTNGVSSIHIHQRRSYFSGQYGVSLPANTDASAANQAAPRSLWVQVDDCTGAGWATNNFKGCVDLTGTSFNEAYLRLVSHNSNFAAELKRTGDATNTSPNGIRRVYAEIVADTTLDLGPVTLLAYENAAPTLTADAWRGLTLKADVKGALPLPRLPSTFYAAGDTFSSGNGHTYIVVKAGITDATSGPSGTTAGTGYLDGTAMVSHVQVTPGFVAGTVVPNFTNASGVQVEALTQADIDVMAQGMAYGARLWPTGSSDNTIRDLTLRVRGVVSRGCVADQAIPRIGSGQAVDNLRISASNCRAVGNSPAIIIGGTAANPVNYTNCSIVGSYFGASGGTSAFGFRNSGGSVDCDMVGTYLQASNSAIYAEGPTNLRIAGGKLESTGGVGLVSGVINGQTGSSGTIDLRSVPVRNTNTSFGTVFIAGGTLSVVGQAINAPSAAAPAQHCTAGVDYAPGTVPASAYLWGCPTTDNWAKAY